MSELQAVPVEAIRIAGIRKTFPGVVALNNVDLSLRAGEIHALLGENGAGKSTLIRVLTGVCRADGGSFHVQGRPSGIETPKDAIKAGIKVVPQDIVMVPELSIGRNILLGMEAARTSKDRLTAQEEATVAEALARTGATFSPHAKTVDLTVPQRRLAQIARALIQPGDVMILDEPTAVLSEPDADHLLGRLEQFRDEGKAILYVTHRLSEVMRMANRVTILRDGERVGCFARDDITRQEIVALMAKNGVAKAQARMVRERLPDLEATPRLQVEGLTLAPHFHDVSFRAGQGEILGIAGVQGSGHGSLLRALAGADRAQFGTIRVEGRRFDNPTSRRAVAKGILYVPADRRGAGILAQLPVRANIAISARAGRGVRKFGLRWHAAERAVAKRYVDEMSIRPGNPDALIGYLSGGNQQKVVIARALEGNASLLLIEEPTQGVDVGAKAEIHALLRKAAYEFGCTVVIATSEFEELLGLADRILVMRDGRIVEQLDGASATYRDILEHALP